MLINKMRFGDITLSWVHTNLVLKKFKNLRKVEAFKVLGMKMIVLSQLGMTDKMHSQLTNLRVGRKLEMVKVVLLVFIWGKILTPLIELPIKHV